MTYAISITQKGQFTLPKAVRDALDITTPDQVDLTFNTKTKSIRFSKTPTFAELGGFINKKTKKPIKNAVQMRKIMENDYSRN